MNAREIIAKQVRWGEVDRVSAEVADNVITALHAAGIRLAGPGDRILGPDEVDQLERLAKGDIPGVWQEKFEKAQEIARALGRKA